MIDAGCFWWSVFGLGRRERKRGGSIVWIGTVKGGELGVNLTEIHGPKKNRHRTVKYIETFLLVKFSVTKDDQPPCEATILYAK